MGFLGRLDFYREYGFYVSVRINGTANYRVNKERQAAYDRASLRLKKMTVSEVIDAAISDGIRDKKLVKPLIDSLMRLKDNAASTALMKDYLKPFSDDWENRCDEYVLAIEGLKRIPSIRHKYFDLLKMTSIGVSLIWNEADMQWLNVLLRNVQEEQTH